MVSFTSILLLILSVICASAAWLFFVEAPRISALLVEVERQQHARSLDGEDAAEATAHAESLKFIVRPLALTVTYKDEDGNDRTDNGVAEMLTVEDDVAASAASQRPVFLMVPGNPGLVNFYKLFIMYLHRLTKGKVEFRCVSFVGHTSEPLNGGRILPFQGQLAFFKEVIRLTFAEIGPKRNIFLGGHSVGAFTVLHMLDSLSAEQSARVLKAFMLFPTITDIASTPNGIIHTPILRHLRPLCVAMVYIIAELPKAFHTYLFHTAIGLQPYEVAGASGLLTEGTAAACLSMANDEMSYIRSLDMDRFIRPHLNRLYFIWGHTDAWAPLSQLEELKRRFPGELQFELAHRDAAHAFVVGGSHLVAPVVAEQIKKFI